MTNTPVLQQPNTTWLFIIETDASNHTCGTVLLQMEEGSTVEHLIAYKSWKFNLAEACYTTHE